MIPLLHVGTDHLWWFSPLFLLVGVAVFVGAIALRSRLKRWVDEPDDGGEGEDN